MTPRSGSQPSSSAPTDLSGVVLGGRYQLDALVGQGAEDSLWRGSDLVLARTIAVRVIRTGPSSAALLRAAAAAGRISSRHLVADLDAADDPDHPYTYLVREWVEARDLAQLLADGPLPPGKAVTVALGLAEAVDAAHREGAVHGRIDPGDVLVTPEGRVLLSDLGVRAALDGGPAPTTGDDLKAVGFVLYAALTGAWPERGTALPKAPRGNDGELCSPRQVRAGVPRELDLLTTRIIDPRRRSGAAPIRTASELVALLRAKGPEPLVDDARAPLAADEAEHRWVRRLRRAIPFLLLGVIGITGWLLGIGLGTVPSQGDGVNILSSDSPQPGQPTPQGKLQLSVRDFDPPPGDGEEGHATVAFSHDGDVRTPWETAIYQGSPRLGGLKKGVGLLVDLGSARTVREVQLQFGRAGTDLELRAADRAGGSVDDYQVVATATRAGRTASLRPSDATPHRYWVIWLTSLPRTPDGYQGAVAEMVFRT